MASVVTINKPEVVALIERAAAQLTGGNKTAAVELALSRLLQESGRTAPLYGAHPGSARVKPGVDLTAPVLEDRLDAEGLPLAAALRARAAGVKGYRGSGQRPRSRR